MRSSSSVTNTGRKSSLMVHEVYQIVVSRIMGQMKRGWGRGLVNGTVEFLGDDDTKQTHCLFIVPVTTVENKCTQLVSLASP